MNHSQPTPNEVYDALYALGVLHLRYPAITHFKIQDFAPNGYVCDALVACNWAHVLIDDNGVYWFSITSAGANVLRDFYGIELVAHGAT